MAIEKVYGDEINSTPASVLEERGTATKRHSEAITGDVQRVNYAGRTIEVATIDHRALGRPVDAQYERNYASVRTRLDAIGWSTATVVSFLPWELRSDSTLESLRGLKISPPKDSEPYAVHSFTDVEITPTRMGADSPLLAF